MITPERMRKIRIVTPKSRMYDVINSIYDLNLFHIKKYRKGELAGLDSCGPMIQAEELSTTLMKLRSIKDKLSMKGAARFEPRVLAEKEFKKLNAKVSYVYEQCTKKLEGIKELDDLLKKLHEQRTLMRALNKLKIDLNALSKVKQIAYFVGTVKDYGSLKTKMGASKTEFELKKTSINGESLVTLFVGKKEEFKARSVLNEVGFAEVKQEEISHLRLSDVEKRINKLEAKKSNLKESVRELKTKNAKYLLENEILLEEEIKKAELPLSFATTAQSFIATGFVPSKSVRKIKAELESVTKGNVLIESEEPGHEENVPVKLDNRKAVRNFEVLTRLYELPQYLEVDPSVLMFLTFPLFFGFMLGDVGYGIATLLLFTYLKKKIPSGKQFLNVLIFASIVSIAFGFVYGEYLGFEHLGYEKGKALFDNVGICFNEGVLEGHGEKTIVWSFPRLLSDAIWTFSSVITWSTSGKGARNRAALSIYTS